MASGLRHLGTRRQNAGNARVAFLDEVMPINEPLLLIPKNHK